MAKKKLGKYELLSPLGSGATAEVYRARDTMLGREVTLKILKPALVADPSTFERFVKEAQAAASLFHPHIATVLDMGEAEGRYFIAMRYILGQSLDKVLSRKKPLSWQKTLCMARQIGEALDFAHRQGFLHRDVKPSNIICTPEGDFVLTDFGLQRAMQNTGLTSHSGSLVGTPPYIAPEIWEDKPAVPSTDQYALACVVYEAVTGKALFPGDTPPAVMKRHMDGWAQHAHWPRNVPQGITAVMAKALSKQPEDRYSEMRLFAEAIENLSEGDGREGTLDTHGSGTALEGSTQATDRSAIRQATFPRYPSGRTILWDKRSQKRYGLFALMGGILVISLLMLAWGIRAVYFNAGGKVIQTVIVTEIIEAQVTSVTILATVTLTPTPKITISTEPFSITDILTSCPIEIKQTCIYTLFKANEELMITLEGITQKEGIYLTVDGVKYECQKLNQYPNRLYCLGPSRTPGSKIHIQLKLAENDQVISQASMLLPYYFPTPTPLPPSPVRPGPTYTFTPSITPSETPEPSATQTLEPSPTLTHEPSPTATTEPSPTEMLIPSPTETNEPFNPTVTP